MKKILLLISLAFLMCNCGQKLTEKVTESFPNGQPQYVKILDRSGNCVKEIEYYETGQIKMEGSIQNNRREGEWKAYYLDGRPQSIGFFKAGEMDGVSKVYWENGNLRWEGSYKADKRCGKWKYYDEQGFLTKEADYGFSE